MTWAIPNWWAFALLALAAWRTFHLFSEDVILDPVKRRVLARFPSERLAEFMDCAYCLGTWCAVAWWLAWIVSAHWALIVAVPFALSAVVALVAVNLDPD